MTNVSYKRSARVAAEVYQIVSEVCYTELSDPRIVGIQITDVDVTDDLQIAKIYYYISGPEDVRKNCSESLERAKGFFKRAISSKLQLRVVPEVVFYFDENIEMAEKLDQVIDELKKTGAMGDDE